MESKWGVVEGKTGEVEWWVKGEPELKLRSCISTIILSPRIHPKEVRTIIVGPLSQVTIHQLWPYLTVVVADLALQ